MEEEKRGRKEGGRKAGAVAQQEGRGQALGQGGPALLWVGGGLGEGSTLSLWPQDQGCLRAISPGSPSAQHLRTWSLLAEADGYHCPWCPLVVGGQAGPSPV